ncbi:HNH endonuclease, partial [Streptomyces sp. NPDC005180]|uniref:HNH endonuclease n=1 Tax=Streptomyces sp. NPDC005180 TaxID=3156868 RepID=UPI0033B9F8AB
TYLKSERGLTVVGTGGYLAFLISGAFIGYLTGGYLTDVLGRKKNILLFAVLSAACILAYTNLPSGANGLLLVLGFPLGFCMSAIFSGFGSFLSELYPTAVRGTSFLIKFAWTGIVRHQLVKGGASPDDPALTEYWRDRRRRKAPPPMDKTSLLLAVRQQGLCPLCKQALIVGAEYEPDSPREWINWFAASKKMLHKHHFTYRRDGGTDERNNLRLVHSECHRQHHAGDSKRTT